MKGRDNISEELFATLCSQFYLRGFVFHSPKFYAPTEQEVGDVVLWVRTHLIVFEIVWRDVTASGSTKNFVKQIGRKRDQLIRDFGIYGNNDQTIRMKNEFGGEILYDHDCFAKENFCGVVLVDSDVPLEKLHFDTVRKSLDQECPIAIITKQDFLDILAEIDTTSDLLYYLKDRRIFLRQIFQEEANTFLNLSFRNERNLMGFYKLNNNSFPIDAWRSSTNKEFWLQYQQNYAERIRLRDRENQESFIFDTIIELLRNSNSQGNSTLLHSWELAILHRRFRAGLARKLNRAFEQMVNQKSKRHFAYINPNTGCWSLFYFQYGGDRESFIQEAERITKMKMYVERVQSGFRYSVFCYAFRKSLIETGNTFDDCVLRLEDADKYSTVSYDEYQEARHYFHGTTEQQKIYEFPS